MGIAIPARLALACRQTPHHTAWLAVLPDTIAELARRWSLTLGAPFDGDEVSCAWVTPATLSNGDSAVLKLGMPHLEAAHEIEGLLFWNGDAMVRVLDADVGLGAILLERCHPGSHLHRSANPIRTSSSPGSCAGCGGCLPNRTRFVPWGR